MGGPEMEKLTAVSVGLAKVEVAQEQTAIALDRMSGSVDRLVDKLEKSDVLARDAEQRSRSAHHRIDELKKVIEDERKRVDAVESHYDSEIRVLNTKIDLGFEKLNSSQKNAIDKMEDKMVSDRRWRIATLITLCSLTIGVVTLLINIMR